MSDLVAVAFDDEASAFELRSELAKLQKEYLLEMEDVVVVTRGPDGKVQLHQAVNLSAAGAVGGGFWGALIGLLFLNPLLGAAVGAGGGALGGALTDIGINDDFIRDTAAAVPEGGSAVFVLLRKITADKVLARLQEVGLHGRVLQSSLSAENEAKLREVLAEANGLPGAAPE